MTSKIRRLMVPSINGVIRSFHRTSGYLRPWEINRKSGYPRKYAKPIPVMNFTERVREGYHQLFEELKIWKDEVKEKLMYDPIVVLRPNEVDVQWRFSDDPKSLDEWIVTCDSDYNQGYSVANLQLSLTGKGIFSGKVSTRLPDDGKINKSGFCNIKASQARKSFHRTAYYDWQNYTHLVLRVRGDGRNYMVNLSTKGCFDVTWNDLYQYVLYTRGGPYWQIIRIAFSKFIFANKNAIQDEQSPVPLHQIYNLNITVCDVPGPFKLEIDYIGLEYDPMHTEECAYESYQVDGFVGNT